MATNDTLLFIHVKYLLSTYSMSGTVLDIWDMSVNEIDNNFCPHESVFWKLKTQTEMDESSPETVIRQRSWCARLRKYRGQEVEINVGKHWSKIKDYAAI